MPHINIKENSAKTILSKSGIPGCDYVINPYVGCLHGCQYCYASFMARYTKHLETWGDFIDIKINAATLLNKELLKKKPKTVFLSSVTDPYNPLEKKYKITRQLLKILLKYQISISILTKSDLIIRDIDLLKQFNQCQVGFSFFTHKQTDVKNFEKHTATPNQRLKAIKKLKENNITSYAFIAPIMPYITNIEKLFLRLKIIEVDFILCDRLNNRDQAHNRVQNVINHKYPWLTKTYKHIFNVSNDFWSQKAKYIKKIASKHNLDTKVLFK